MRQNRVGSGHMMVLLMAGFLLIVGALTMVLLNLQDLQAGSVTSMVSNRIRPVHHVTHTLRDNPDAFHAAILFKMVFSGLMLLVGIALAWVSIRQLRRTPTKPNGDPWWFI